jgi:GH15 family glucan-1,4-alpha-glucosidase
MSPDSYPPIGDYALIGDCHTAALVSRDCSIDWCCLPRFDPGSAFGRLLDWKRGGFCQIAPARGTGPWDSTPEYLRETLVLQTTLRCRTGEASVLDCLTVGDRVREPRGSRLLRVIDGQQGSVELDIRIAPRFDYGQVTPWIRREGRDKHCAVGGNDAVIVHCDEELEEDPAHELVARVRVGVGDRVRLVLEYCPPERAGERMENLPDTAVLDRELQRTIAWWRDWASRIALLNRDEPAARRSGIVLKALTYAPTGAIAARRPRRCLKSSGACATGTTATPGCGTRASAPGRSPSSVRSRRPTRSGRSSCARLRGTPRSSKSCMGWVASAV